ncbi:MAG: MaoC family dehydratase N-terminal domain-containing protein, partial [Deltaproteobacteria bacterium]|nr:MaoC family dehydratase N-terminal domain-containing protein [Deltaproteobacteria bacterium]
ARGRFGGLLSPPAMLFTWIIPLQWTPERRPAEPALTVRIPLPGSTIINTEQEVVLNDRIRVGDQMTAVERFDAVSQEKQSRLGTGHFITTSTDFFRTDAAGNAEEEPVGSITNTLFRYDPAAPDERPEAAPQERSVASRPAIPSAPVTGGPSPAVGEALAKIELELTLNKVVKVPSATLDFIPLHYDPDYARRQGHPNIFLNTMTLLAMADRLVLEWAGQDAFIRRHHIGMRYPLHAGDTMVATGRVTDVGPYTGPFSDEFDSQAVVAAELCNQSGRLCCACEVTVALRASDLRS